jgi:hypothetical protein
MGKAIAAAVVALVVLIFTDQQLNYGRYTDAAVVVMRQLRHAFG